MVWDDLPKWGDLCKCLGLVLGESLMSSMVFPLANNDTLASMEGIRVPGVLHFQLRLCGPDPQALG